MYLTGHIFDYFLVYWAGVLVSFTPCIYPVLPITAGFIAGVNTRGTKLMGFIISLVYVLGIAVTYCALAVFATLSGSVFGQWQNQPAVYFAVANILLFFALAMLDVVPLPSLGINAQSRARPRTLWAVLAMGLAAGLVIGPCTAPVLGTLLLYVAAKNNLVHGVSLLFVFSYGVGTSLILVGTFSGLLANLPRSGPWLFRIKRFCGFVLLFAAEYFLIMAGRMIL